MSARRNYRRDRLGRFAGAGTKVAATAKGARAVGKAAAKTGARKVTKQAKDSYVSGSFTKNLEVGRGGEYAGIKAGAEFKTPKGRGVLVKAVVGVHGKPDRRLTITPSLDKKQKKLAVTATRNPAAARRASAGKKMKR